MRFTGLWLEAPLDTPQRRVERRTRDASDARPDAVALKAGWASDDIEWCRVDAGGEKAAVLDHVRRVLSTA